MQTDPNVVFHEEQRFRAWWIWLLLVAAAVAGIVAMAAGFQEEDPVGKAISIGVAILLVGLLWLFVVMTLVTEVDIAEVRVRFKPFRGRVFPRSSIIDAAVVTYRPIRQYWGWGIRRGSEADAYTVSGDEGVMIDTGDKRKFLVGSQRADELGIALGATRR